MQKFIVGLLITVTIVGGGLAAVEEFYIETPVEEMELAGDEYLKTAKETKFQEVYNNNIELAKAEYLREILIELKK